MSLGGDHGMNMRYEGQEPSPLPDQSGIIAGGVVVLATTFEHPASGERVAGLAFRFATPTGEFSPVVVLCVDDDELLALPDLVRHAVRDARRAAA
jgi:hypothetical protein